MAYNIILGATGQVGSMVAEHLLEQQLPVKVVARKPDKAKPLEEKGAVVCKADYFDGDSLQSALQDGEKVFLLTPENPFRKNIMQDARNILRNYHDAIQHSDIREIIGLSSFGAQFSSGTGNLEISYRLEHAFDDLDIQKTFIRPSYYYSNWMGYCDVAKEHGLLPSFFPADLEIPMTAPCDVAAFIADVIAGKRDHQPVFEITGPSYSANEIAAYFGVAFGREVTAMPVPENKWVSILKQGGFTKSGAQNLALMTKAVIAGKTRPEHDPILMPTAFDAYLETNTKNQQ